MQWRQPPTAFLRLCFPQPKSLPVTGSTSDPARTRQSRSMRVSLQSPPTLHPSPSKPPTHLLALPLSHRTPTHLLTPRHTLGMPLPVPLIQPNMPLFVPMLYCYQMTCLALLVAPLQSHGLVVCCMCELAVHTRCSACPLSPCPSLRRCGPTCDQTHAPMDPQALGPAPRSYTTTLPLSRHLSTQ